MGAKLIRVGGVGTGRIFQHAHMRIWPALHGRGRLVGFFDVNQARAQQAKAKYVTMLEEHAAAHPEAGDAVRQNISDLVCYETLDEMLPNVDLVDICTHARGRMPVAIAAFQKGVHAMAEKPMARVWTEADRAARVLAKSKGVFFQLNDDNVFEPKYRAIRSIIASISPLV